MIDYRDITEQTELYCTISPREMGNENPLFGTIGSFMEKILHDYGCNKIEVTEVGDGHAPYVCFTCWHQDENGGTTGNGLVGDDGIEEKRFFGRLLDMGNWEAVRKAA